MLSRSGCPPLGSVARRAGGQAGFRNSAVTRSGSAASSTSRAVTSRPMVARSPRGNLRSVVKIRRARGNPANGQLFGIQESLARSRREGNRGHTAHYIAGLPKEVFNEARSDGVEAPSDTAVPNGRLPTLPPAARLPGDRDRALHRRGEGHCIQVDL